MTAFLWLPWWVWVIHAVLVAFGLGRLSKPETRWVGPPTYVIHGAPGGMNLHLHGAGGAGGSGAPMPQSYGPGQIHMGGRAGAHVPGAVLEIPGLPGEFPGTWTWATVDSMWGRRRKASAAVHPRALTLAEQHARIAQLNALGAP
jgi:hypothetical protein